MYSRSQQIVKNMSEVSKDVRELKNSRLAMMEDEEESQAIPGICTGQVEPEESQAIPDSDGDADAAQFAVLQADGDDIQMLLEGEDDSQDIAPLVPTKMLQAKPKLIPAPKKKPAAQKAQQAKRPVVRKGKADQS